MTNIKYLHEFIGTTIKHLEQVQRNGVKRELSFEISCSNLEDFNHFDIRQSANFKTMFDELKIANGPTLYWFEIISETDTLSIITELKKYKKNINAKSTPALKNNINYDSRILYVGKVKGAFWGRLIQHLGFFKVNATQGLQLFYWTRSLALTIKVNVIEFDIAMADIMPTIELAFAQRLQPLIGKHK